MYFKSKGGIALSIFKLIPGVEIPNTSEIKREYQQSGNNITLNLSAGDYTKFFKSVVDLLPEPVFFFIEIPKDEGEGYETYYLDNCTTSVAKAILKRYGGILFSDGVIRFGFGSHTAEEEIFMQEYQLLSIYSGTLQKFAKLVEKLGYTKTDQLTTAWDVLNEENVGKCESVDFEDESYLDIIEQLQELGLYKAE